MLLNHCWHLIELFSSCKLLYLHYVPHCGTVCVSINIPLSKLITPTQFLFLTGGLMANVIVVWFKVNVSKSSRGQWFLQSWFSYIPTTWGAWTVICHLILQSNDKIRSTLIILNVEVTQKANNILIYYISHANADPPFQSTNCTINNKH